MFIAMNRFAIRKRQEEAFETIWRERDSHLNSVPGFLSFHLLRGPFNEATQTTLYASHTMWKSEEDFANWTKSQNFRDAHKNADKNEDIYAAHPQFEGFEVVLEA